MAQKVLEATYSGRIYNSNDNWDTLRVASLGTVDVNGYLSCYTYMDAVETFWLHRNFLIFDTSSISADDTITSVSLSLYCIYEAGAGTRTLGLVQTTQASDGTLVADDYDQMGTVEGASRIKVDSYPSWKTWSLNSVYFSWINTSGSTKLGIRTWHDLDNDPPDYSGEGEYTKAQFAGYNNYYYPTYLPKLIINHFPIVTQPLGFLQGQRKPGGFLTGLKQESKSDMIRKPGGFLGGSKKAQ